MATQMDTLLYYSEESSGINSYKFIVENKRRCDCEFPWDGCTVTPSDLDYQKCKTEDVFNELDYLKNVKLSSSLGECNIVKNPKACFMKHIIRRHACRNVADMIIYNQTKSASVWPSSVFISAQILDILLQSIIKEPDFITHANPPRALSSVINFTLYKNFSNEIGHCGTKGTCLYWLKLIVQYNKYSKSIVLKTMYPIATPNSIINSNPRCRATSGQTFLKMVKQLK